MKAEHRGTRGSIYAKRVAIDEKKIEPMHLAFRPAALRNVLSSETSSVPRSSQAAILAPQSEHHPPVVYDCIHFT